MVTEEEETRDSIANTLSQLANSYNLAQGRGEKAKIEREAKKFIKSIAKGKDEVAEYLKMYNGLKG